MWRATIKKLWLPIAGVLLLASALGAAEEEFASARAGMVAALRRQGIGSERVLKAMAKVPRHRFAPDGYGARAYREAEIPFSRGEVMSSPYVIARMTEVLYERPHARVLEVGTGSGYQTAVLAELSSQVYTVERQRAAEDWAAARLRGLGYRNIKFQLGEEANGWPANAPYDAILITCTVERIPEALVRQLADGGCLVAPAGRGPEQTLDRYKRVGDQLQVEAVLPLRLSASMNQPKRRQ
jgi:protein-L-isoaspartate(D-aspartate) O-methyltransferase